MEAKFSWLKFPWLLFKRYNIKRISILMWKRFFALRFTLFAASHNIRFTTKNQPASRSKIHFVMVTSQFILSVKNWTKTISDYCFKIKALSLQTSIYVRTSNGNRFRRQTIRPLPKRYKLKENCLHSIKITRLLFKWVFLNFECCSVMKIFYRYKVSPT